MEQLLRLGLDPDIGDPSPLDLAVQHGEVAYWGWEGSKGICWGCLGIIGKNMATTLVK